MIDSQNLPHLLKYMGSKRELLPFVVNSIESLNTDSVWLCDLFSGTSVVGCSLKDKFNIHSNDIQSYSSIFSNTYLQNLNRLIDPKSLEQIENKIRFYVDEFYKKYEHFSFEYKYVNTFEELIEIEEKQQNLINLKFGIGFNLFTKYYSGTYWSFDQCVWIDSIRAIAEEYKGYPEYYVILSSLIYAMSYTSQGTGHFAQFRDVTESNMDDIMIYRNRSIWPYFQRKFIDLVSNVNYETNREFRITNLDYIDCLRIIDDNTIVYADPPYSSVHYSRFYHAIETLVKYDYPQVKYKGRYREDRHQSPFGKKTEVVNAFRLLFECVKARKSHMVLSYSDNGMITQNEIFSLGKEIFGSGYLGEIQTKEYIHSKMGRSDEHVMDVNEIIISYKRI